MTMFAFWPLAFMTLGLTWLIHFLYDRYQVLRTFERLNIPGPPPRGFLVGHLSLSDRSYYLKQFPKWFAAYGEYFGYYRGDRPVLVVRRPDMVQEVFSRSYKSFPNRFRFPLTTRPFKYSIICYRDDRWRKVRKTLAPAFTAMQISKPSLRQLIFGSIERLDKVLRTGSMSTIVEHQDGETLMVNASHLGQCFTLETIAKIAFALETTDILERDDSRLMALMKEFMYNIDISIIKAAQVLPFLKPVLNFFANYVTSGRVIDLLIKQLKIKISDYHREHWLKQEGKQCDDDHKRSVLMDYILQQTSEGHLTENEAIGNLMVILIAGYETTAMCAAFTLYVLAQHQQIQSQLREKLIEFFEQNGLNDPEDYCRFFSSKDNQEPLEVRVELLDRIIYESMRLYPPVTDFVIREMSDQLSEVRLQSEPSLVLPHNVAIQVPVWPIHHDSQHWPDPFTFNPNRPGLPIPGATSEEKNPLFAAFGLGQRSCLGNHLAIAELRHLLAALVLNYDIQLCNKSDRFGGYDLDENGMLMIEGNTDLIRPVKEIKLQFCRRQ